MGENWLMLPGEAAKWSHRLTGDWPLIVWKSLALSSCFITLYVGLLYLMVVGLTPALRRPFSRKNLNMTPVHSMLFLFLATTVASFTHSVVFSTGVIAYWVNESLPAGQLEAISKWTFSYLTFWGLAFS